MSGNPGDKKPPVKDRRRTSSSSSTEIGTLAVHFDDALSVDKPDTVDKPDILFPNLGSPISPLRSNIAGGATTSSSGSSGTLPARRTGTTSRNNSGELSGASSGSSGGGGGGGGGGSSPTAESLLGSSRNVRTGNIIQPSLKKTTRSPDNVRDSGVKRSPDIAPKRHPGPPATGLVVQTGIPSKSGSAPPKTASQGSGRSDVLCSGKGVYGHGSVMRGSTKSGEVHSPSCGNVPAAESPAVRRALESKDLEELRKVGNEFYKKGQFVEALKLYDEAIAISPTTATFRGNRAAALAAMDRIMESIRECNEALRLDPNYTKVHHRLGVLYTRLGLVNDAKGHLNFSQPDPAEMNKLGVIEKHLIRCGNSRSQENWKTALREGDAARANGADSSPLLLALRAEALLELGRLDEADSALSSIPKFESFLPSSLSKTSFGMTMDAYVNFVRAKVGKSLGRFENAVSFAEKAAQLDVHNHEITTLVNKVREVKRARSKGNELFKSGYYAEASTAYAEGLEADSSNPVLYCNRAACRAKLGQWERVVDDCTVALSKLPRYTKALLRRADSYAKLERWQEAVRDYETLRHELPDDTEVAESLFHAQVALKRSRGENVQNMKFGGEVETITDSNQLRAAIFSPGVSVVHFMTASNEECQQVTPFFSTLCSRFPSVNFLKVDVVENQALATSESIMTVPTFKIYKNGARLKEMICPTHENLEHSVRHYSFK